MKSKCLFVKYFSFILILSTLFVNCEKKESIGQDLTISIDENDALSVTLKNEMIEKYALILAHSMSENELRSTIKSEAQLMFDGDYSILTKTLDNKLLPKIGITVNKYLASSYSKTMLKSDGAELVNLSGEEFLERIKKVLPNLQVAVPIHCDEWDTDSHIPLVAFLPYDFNEHTAKVITAYDIQGNKHKLSLGEEPTEPVIVVSRSERVDENGEMIGLDTEYYDISSQNSVTPSNSHKSEPAAPVSLNIIHGDSRQVILEWADVANETSYEVWRKHSGEYQFHKFATTGQNDNGYINSWIEEGAMVAYKIRAINRDGYSAFSPIMTTTVSARNSGEWLKIKRMKFSGDALSAVESWALGAPEIRLRVVMGRENGASTVFTSGRMEPGRRKHINGTWWNREVPILSWQTNAHGTVFTFDWREEDLDDDVEFTISTSYEDKLDNGTLKVGGDVVVKNDAGADHIGSTSVLWWDKRDHIYNITGFEWQFVY